MRENQLLSLELVFFFSGRFSRPMNQLNFSPFRDRYCLIEKAVKKKRSGNILKFDRLIKVLIKLDERQSALSLN